MFRARYRKNVCLSLLALLILLHNSGYSQNSIGATSTNQLIPSQSYSAINSTHIGYQVTSIIVDGAAAGSSENNFVYINAGIGINESKISADINVVNEVELETNYIIFDESSEPQFSSLLDSLNNGIDEVLSFDHFTYFTNGWTGGPIDKLESEWGLGTPDLQGSDVNMIALNLTLVDIYFSEIANGWDLVHKVIWEFWSIEYDTTPPLITIESTEIQFEVGTSVEINWLIEDYNLMEYSVYKNGTSYAMGVLNSSDKTISINVVDLEVGGYNFTLVVYDTANNIARSIVMVTINEIPLSESQSKSNPVVSLDLILNSVIMSLILLTVFNMNWKKGKRF